MWVIWGKVGTGGERCGKVATGGERWGEVGRGGEVDGMWGKLWGLAGCRETSGELGSIGRNWGEVGGEFGRGGGKWRSVGGNGINGGNRNNRVRSGILRRALVCLQQM